MKMEGMDVGGATAGFLPQVDTKSKHECNFNPFPNVMPYYKRGDTERTFLTLGCNCGEVKEVMVQDLRQLK